MENSIEFFLNTHLEWSLSHQDLVITTLLLKLNTRVHNWVSKGTSLGGWALLSSRLFWLLECKLSLILPKCLYGVIPGHLPSLRVIASKWFPNNEAPGGNNIINFIQPYLYQFFNDSHSLNGTQKPLKRPFDWCQSHLEAINIGQDIRQINW